MGLLSCDGDDSWLPTLLLPLLDSADDIVLDADSEAPTSIPCQGHYCPANFPSAIPLGRDV